MRIYKYILDITDEQEVMLPRVSSILCIQMQRNRPCMWAIVDEMSDEYASITIKMYGTGQPIGDNRGRYLSTFQTDGGSLVWHTFIE